MLSLKIKICCPQNSADNDGWSDNMPSKRLCFENSGLLFSLLDQYAHFLILSLEQKGKYAARAHYELVILQAQLLVSFNIQIACLTINSHESS